MPAALYFFLLNKQIGLNPSWILDQRLLCGSKKCVLSCKIIPYHTPLRFIFEGKCYQYTVIHLRLFLASCMFTKCKLCFFHILNYLGNWLVLAQLETSALYIVFFCKISLQNKNDRSQLLVIHCSILYVTCLHYSTKLFINVSFCIDDQN